jgi:ATP-dependent exoDNAse (exonuclease V) alpha subunit
MPVPDEARVENGARGTITGLDPEHGALTVRLDGAGREVAVEGEGLGSLRLAYAGHVYRQQGATVDRAVVVTGGWQTSRESAYVQASRARHGAEWHVAREDLDSPDDAGRIDALAQRMGQTRAQEPSLARPLVAPGRAPDDPIAELHVARLRPPVPAPAEPTPGAEIAP